MSRTPGQFELRQPTQRARLNSLSHPTVPVSALDRKKLNPTLFMPVSCSGNISAISLSHRDQISLITNRTIGSSLGVCYLYRPLLLLAGAGTCAAHRMRTLSICKMGALMGATVRLSAPFGRAVLCTLCVSLSLSQMYMISVIVFMRVNAIPNSHDSACGEV
jgi:hypothetical protein